MKVLFDPIYTNDPGHCASNVKFRKLADQLLSKRSDVFIYWLVPAEGTVHHLGMDWFPDHPNIRYVEYPYNRDRQREYIRVDRRYEELVSFYGDLWDFDVMATNRTSFLPNIKAMTIKRGRRNILWAKRVFLIEDMPIMSFKQKLGTFNQPDLQDLHTLLGYVAADRIAISAFWEKDLILKAARNLLAPALVRRIDKTMIESSAIKMQAAELKTRASIERMLHKERPFTCAYIGRMVASSRANEIFQLMQKNWIMHSGTQKLRFLSSTQSQSNGRINVPDFVEVKRLPREGFWDLCRNEIDVYLFMSKEEDYSMSLVEPLTLGTPAILIRDDWSVGTVGPDYPFFVDNFTQAYALLRRFYENYPAMYRQFADWSKNHLTPLLLERNEVYVADLFEQFVAEFEEAEAKAIDARMYADNEVVQLIAKQYPDVVLFDAIKELQAAGKLKFLAEKTDPEFREGVVNAWQTDWYILKAGLRANGYVDASTTTGHFRRA